MGLVKVRNINKHPFEQKFNGQLIHLEPDEAIEMDEEDAVLFKSAFHPFKVDKNGNHNPKFYKMLRIEKPEGYVAKDPIAGKFQCQACKEQTSSWTELEAHMRLMHTDTHIKDEKSHGAKANAGAGAPKG